MPKTVAASLFLLLLFVAVPAVSDESLPTFRFPRDPSFVVLEYAVVGSATPPSSKPYLRIYGDGRVRVYRHENLHKPGFYETYISYERLDSLLVALARDGLLDFDRRDVAAEIRSTIERERSSLLSTGRLELIVSDAATETVRIRLDEYVPAHGGTARRDVNKTVFWNGLKYDAAKYPDVRALQGLHRSIQRLSRLAKHVESYPVD